jgi:cytoskeletal protein CcmA (bactofilin family)
MSASEDVLTIDPVAMNVVNRVAESSNLSGDLEFGGGLLVQGRVSGNVRVRGRVIVWEGATLEGKVRILGDLYLFGQLGASGTLASQTRVECHGTAYIASTGVSTGALHAQKLRLYDGADLQGPFLTMKRSEGLPVLQEEPLLPNSGPVSRS